MLIWVNLHGAFLAGILIWFCYFVGQFFLKDFSWESTKPLLWVGVSSLLMSFINPDGIGIWKTGYEFLSNQYLVGHTAEYLPPNFQESSTWPFLILLLISILLFAITRRRLEMAHLFLVGGWALLAIYSARNIPIFAAVSTPFLSKMVVDMIQGAQNNHRTERYLQVEMKIKELESQIRGGFWVVFSVSVVLLLLITGRRLDFDQAGNNFSAETFPVNAVDWIEKNPLEGNGFNYFPWGGYLLYRIWPENLVFIDGQTDFYGEDLTREYESVITLDTNWLNVIKKYEIN
jgi:hypothetical protein